MLPRRLDPPRRGTGKKKSDRTLPEHGQGVLAVLQREGYRPARTVSLEYGDDHLEVGSGFCQAGQRLALFLDRRDQVFDRQNVAAVVAVALQRLRTVTGSGFHFTL